MGRRSSVGWLVALITIVGMGLVVFVAVPLRTCPTCRGLAKKLAGPSGALSFKVGCPECADRGTVTQPRYFKGSLLAPQVFRLMHCQKDPLQIEFARNLDQVAVLSARDPAEVSGVKFYDGHRFGKAMFRHSEKRDVVLVVLQDWMTTGSYSPAGLVLLGLDGSVLDYLHCACSNAWGSMTPEILEEAADGAVVVLRARVETELKDLNGRGANLKAVFEGKGRDLPARGEAQSAWRIGLKNGRFVILGE